MTEAFLDCGVELRFQQTDHQRQSERLEVDNVETSVRQAGFYKPGVLRNVKVLDVSHGGMSFESPSPMSPGQRVEMKIDMPVKNGIKAVGRVKYSIKWASNFRIGVEFTEINPAERRLLTKENFEPPV